MRLKTFGKKIINICHDAGINPILYGGLAFLVYTKDKNIKVKDIDFYVPEKSFEKIIKILESKKIKYNYSKKWHTLQIFRGKLKVELDSLDFWYRGAKNFRDFNFGGLHIKILSLSSLRKVYKRASENSDKPEQNRKKYEVLKELK